METTIVANAWQQSKILVKAMIITAITLLLLIPAYFVKQLVLEREATQQAATAEVTSAWAARQNVRGPILVLPYTLPDSDGRITGTKEGYIYLLPDSLNIEGDVTPVEKHRGIYQVMLYSSNLSIKGRFNPISLETLRIDPARVLWSKAYISFGLTDMKGLDEQLVVNWNDHALDLAVSDKQDDALSGDFTSPVTILPGEAVNFSANLKIHGSQQLVFTPVGKQTAVMLASSWPNPSFTGPQSPTSRVTDSGFKATWKTLAHTRNYPQAWTMTKYNMEPSAYGAELFIPVTDYQKVLRSVKYAILCIVLTFAAFFLVETSAKRSIHPLQYALVGLALILFYTLLLSFSEYVGFDGAYGIASLATIGLIAWFVKGLLQSGRLSSVIAMVLALIYAYVFSILQLEAYSLLLGSLGLFLTLAVIMRFSRTLKW